MDDKKTIKTGSGGAGGEEEPTQLVGPGGAPVVRSVLPGADQPTPRPHQAGWGIPAPSETPAWFGGQPAAPRAESATVLLDQRAVTAVFAWLVIMDGPERGRIHSLRPDTTTVGRATGNDVVVPDDACSGQHLKIRLEPVEGGEATFVLIDLASRNGTYAGSKETYRNASSRVYRHVLRDGDYLLLGETTLVFKKV
jgi:pSer/pThr/pTyr-binding forkhead associated (FHA) protein